MEGFEKYILNNYFHKDFLEKELPKHFSSKSDVLFNKIKKIYSERLTLLNEAQLENDFIQPILKLLGYEILQKENISYQGKTHQPDYTLFLTEKDKNTYLSSKQLQDIDTYILVEAKSWKTELDNKKINDSNPHFQLIRYLNYLKSDYGILTNGHFWRLYDGKLPSSNKVFYEVNLGKILEDDNIEAFEYFYTIFRKDNFIKKENTSLFDNYKEKNEQKRIELENDLKAVIYGKESIIYTVSKAIYEKLEKQDQQNPKKLNEILENAILFAFRLLFLSYFESRFKNILENHTAYPNYISINYLLEEIKKRPLEDFDGYSKLKDLFSLMDKGNKDLDLPLLNGGLFSTEQSQLLEIPKLLNNKKVMNILEKMIYHSVEKENKRDYQSLSVNHLGNIYEGLLEYELRIAIDKTYYIKYKEKKGRGDEKEGYYDTYNYEDIKKKYTITYEERYNDGELYLTSQSNNRKTTASYYTPMKFTHFMVKEAIEAIVEKKHPLEIKIIDNACGSGHFLVEALSQLTDKIYKDDELYKKLVNLVNGEKSKIEESLKKYNFKYKVDDLQVLKRLLLKKTIFGVDINPFSVELTKLSLWIDSFIFGTPLSFIEHHIKVGNALIGSTIKDGQQMIGDKKHGDMFLFDSPFNIEELKKVFHKLSYMEDSTQEAIEESKRIYTQEILPAQEKIQKLLDFNVYYDFYQNKDIRCLEKNIFQTESPDMKISEKTLLDHIKSVMDISDSPLKNAVESLQSKYQFFHYDVEFPESEEEGFDIIIGNPPWDKTKFEEPLFFSQYRSSYRTMTHSQKKGERENLLSTDYIRMLYDREATKIYVSNEYYKSQYPFNRGAGNSNLFRYFMEKNLSLLNSHGTLTYLTPSSWTYEDSSENIRKHLWEKYQLNFFYQFENRKGIFQNIHRSYKFALYQITLAKKKQQTIPVRFMKHNPDILQTQENIIDYPMEDISKLSPGHEALFEVQTDKDLPIIRKLQFIGKPLNPNYLDFRNELNMTNERDIMEETPREKTIPLYEGKMIHQYHSQFTSPTYYVDEEKLKRRLKSVEISRMIDHICQQIGTEEKRGTKRKIVLEALGYTKEEELEQHVSYGKDSYRLAFRNIARNTDERTLIFGMIPKGVSYGNSLQGSLPHQYIFKDKQIEIVKQPMEKLLWVMSVYNSIVMDYMARFTIDINANKTYVMRLPVLQPTFEEMKSNSIYQKVIKNAGLLTIAHGGGAFEDIQQQLNIASSDIPSSQKAIDKLRIQNDCLIARLYGISHDDLSYIVSTFISMNRQNPQYGKTLLEEYGKK